MVSPSKQGVPTIEVYVTTYLLFNLSQSLSSRFLNWRLFLVHPQEASSEGKEEAPAASVTTANATEGDET